MSALRRPDARRRGLLAGGHATVPPTGVTLKRPAPIVVASITATAARQHELFPFACGVARRSRSGSRSAPALAPELAPLGIPIAPARWIVGGASLGGLAALCTHFAAPEVFGRALCLSPSLGLGGRRLFAWLAAQPLPWTSRIYLDCGVREGRGTTLPRVAAVAALLCSRMAIAAFASPRCARSHDDVSWRRRLPGAFASCMA